MRNNSLRFLTHHVISCLLLFFIFFFTASSKLQAKKPKTVSRVKRQQIVAIVNNKKITLKEFKKRYDEVRRKVLQAPTPKDFLNDLIRYEIGVQEANKQNIKNLPIVKERLNQEIYKVYIERSIGKKVEKIKINSKEMREYYKRNPIIHTRHILVEHPLNPNKKQIEEARIRSKKICKKVKEKKYDFRKAARIYSDDSFSKASGGDIGFRSRFTLAHIPSYYNAVLKMKKGQVKCFVKTKQGFHIIQLVDILPYRKANRNQLKAGVFDEKRARIFHDFFNNLIKRHKVKKNFAVLKSMD